MDGTGAVWLHSPWPAHASRPQHREHARSWDVADDAVFANLGSIEPADGGGVWLVESDRVRLFDGRSFVRDLPVPAAVPRRRESPDHRPGRGRRGGVGQQRGRGGTLRRGTVVPRGRRQHRRCRDAHRRHRGAHVGRQPGPALRRRAGADGGAVRRGAVDRRRRAGFAGVRRGVRGRPDRRGARPLRVRRPPVRRAVVAADAPALVCPAPRALPSSLDMSVAPDGTVWVVGPEGVARGRGSEPWQSVTQVDEPSIVGVGIVGDRCAGC